MYEARVLETISTIAAARRWCNWATSMLFHLEKLTEVPASIALNRVPFLGWTMDCVPYICHLGVTTSYGARWTGNDWPWLRWYCSFCARYKRDLISPRSSHVVAWPNDPVTIGALRCSSSNCRNQCLSGDGCTSARRAEHGPQYFLRLALKRGQSPPTGTGLGSYCCERFLCGDASLGAFKH